MQLPPGGRYGRESEIIKGSKENAWMQVGRSHRENFPGVTLILAALVIRVGSSRDTILYTDVFRTRELNGVTGRYWLYLSPVRESNSV